MSFRTILTRSDDRKGYTAGKPGTPNARPAGMGGHPPLILPEPLAKTLQGVAQPRSFRQGAKRLISPSSLVSLKHNCNDRSPRCGRWTIRGKLENGRWFYKRLGCKSWNCKFCGPRKAKRVRRAIIQQAERLRLCGFLTLTLARQNCSPEESVEYIRKCWRKFRVSLERRFGKTISFIAVLEFQQAGYAHLHILVNRYIPQAWIGGAWQAVGGGRMVDIRRVDIQRIGGYVSKYLTKEMLLGWKRGKFRRYTTSRDIRLFEKPTPGLWVLLKFSLEFLSYHFNGKVLDQKVAEDGKIESVETAEMVF